MKILVTGANGMVAKAAIEHCISVGDDVLALAHQDLDISDKPAVFEFFKREKPDAVLNCAAYTDVDGAETNEEVCYGANVFGVENLALAAKTVDSGFVTISSDYVFDGTKSDFYTQRDTPNPLNSVYSKSKLEGEIRAKNAYARSIIVRSGWIFGFGGNNFLSILPKLLAEGRSIKAITDSYGTPTFANDLAKRMRELVELDLPNTFHVTNSGDGTSYNGYTLKVCELMGYDLSLLERVSADALKRPAPRPKSSKLACVFSERLGLERLPHWESALATFLGKQKEARHSDP
jgi:dTDP-4-dehydrorhamnose reductase